MKICFFLGGGGSGEAAISKFSASEGSPPIPPVEIIIDSLCTRLLSEW